MTDYRLLYTACALQAAGFALLCLSGVFASGAAATSRTGAARRLGHVLCGGGVLAMAVFAVHARHFLLLAGQIVFILLCVLGAARGKRT